MRLTAKELDIAKQIDWCRVEETVGIYAKTDWALWYEAIDSIHIYDQSNWCRFLRQYDKGGDCPKTIMDN